MPIQQLASLRTGNKLTRNDNGAIASAARRSSRGCSTAGRKTAGPDRNAGTMPYGSCSTSRMSIKRGSTTCPPVSRSPRWHRSWRRCASSISPHWTASSRRAGSGATEGKPAVHGLPRSEPTGPDAARDADEAARRCRESRIDYPDRYVTLVRGKRGASQPSQPTPPAALGQVPHDSAEDVHQLDRLDSKKPPRYGSCHRVGQPTGWLLFLGTGGSFHRNTHPELTFADVAEQAGLVHRGQGRGVVHLDYDNDGDQDLVIFNNRELPTLVRNELDPGTDGNGHWLRLSGYGSA